MRCFRFIRKFENYTTLKPVVAYPFSFHLTASKTSQGTKGLSSSFAKDAMFGKPILYVFVYDYCLHCHLSVYILCCLVIAGLTPLIIPVSLARANHFICPDVRIACTVSSNPILTFVIILDFVFLWLGHLLVCIMR